MISGTWPADGGGPIFIRGYQGQTYEQVIAEFHRDSLLLLAQGFEPVGQHYVEGHWGFWYGLLATILTPLLIGIFLWIKALTDRPIGTLTVTYLKRPT